MLFKNLIDKNNKIPFSSIIIIKSNNRLMETLSDSSTPIFSNFSFRISLSKSLQKIKVRIPLRTNRLWDK